MCLGPSIWAHDEIRELVPIRPRVVYTVPVGQNPSGLVCGEIQYFGSRSLSDCCRYHQTMGLERKKAIYDVCVDYGAVPSSRQALFRLDFLGSEKYIILQRMISISSFKYKVETQGGGGRRRRLCALRSKSYFTFLRINAQGRVIRMDTFSKVRCRTLTLSHSLSHFSSNLRSLSADDHTRNAARLVYM
jgi:aromatic amino acid aminotransferase I / 2-aminoadipate transaminase